MHEWGGSPHQRLGEGVREDIGRLTSQSPRQDHPNSFRSSLPPERRIGLDSWWCTAEKLESEADKSMAFFLRVWSLEVLNVRLFVQGFHHYCRPSSRFMVNSSERGVLGAHLTLTRPPQVLFFSRFWCALHIAWPEGAHATSWMRANYRGACGVLSGCLPGVPLGWK